MPANLMNKVVQHLRRAALQGDGAGLSDGQLLECYLSRHEEAAVAALVRRHGPMVWAVCYRVLGNYHDTEDAFQATFLVFVRKAASIVPRERVANWLYGAARQTALKARATTARRKEREKQVREMPEPEAMQQEPWHDLLPQLDEELSRLPDKYRVLIVLCDLEGKTRREVARQFDLPEGTVAGRLARARVMLAKRLARHGLTIAGGALAAALSQSAVSSPIPTSVEFSTIKAASLLAAGQAAAVGVISVKAAALTEGVLRSMLLSKLKIATAVLLVTGIVTAGGLLPYSSLGAERTDTPKNTPIKEEPAKLIKEPVKPDKDQQAIQSAEELMRQAQAQVTGAEAMLKYKQEQYRRFSAFYAQVAAQVAAKKIAKREMEKALETLRATSKNKQQEIEVLNEIEKAVKEMKEKAKQRKD